MVEQPDSHPPGADQRMLSTDRSCGKTKRSRIHQPQNRVTSNDEPTSTTTMATTTYATTTYATTSTTMGSATPDATTPTW